MASQDVSLLLIKVLLSGVVGLFVGSFLNVVIYRAPLGLSVSTPRSFCPTCDRQLTWWENIPVVSWLGLHGRCRTCHQSISIRYPLVESATGTIFALITWHWSGTIFAVPYCLLAATFIAVGLIEYGGQRAPVTLAAIGTGLAVVAMTMCAGWQHRWLMAIGSVIGTAIAVMAYVAVRDVDHSSAEPLGRGTSALLLLGAWTGGLGLAATAAGATAWIAVFSVCMACSWAMVRRAVTPEGSPLTLEPTLHPVVAAPLVTATVAAMTVSLWIGV